MKRQNAVLFYVTDKKRLFLVQEMNGKWGLPGGGLKAGEHPFSAMKREFCEETRQKLPWLSNVQHYDYHGHTRVYYDVSAHRFEPFKPNKEIRAGHFFKLSDIIEYVGGTFHVKNEINLRDEFKSSLTSMLKNDVNFMMFIISQWVK